MTTINLRDNRQVVDYLVRDYDGFRQALIDLIPAKLPEWTDRSEADFGLAVIELFAYMADILSYYQDRVANEAFLPTAQERRSVIEHLKLIGYEMAPAAAASASLSVIVANNVNGLVEVRQGDQFATPSSKERKSVTFEYTAEKPLLINLGNATPDSARKPDNTPYKGFKEIANAIPVREGRRITNEVIGVSTGQPNQRFRLAQPRLLRNTLEIIVDTPLPTPPWQLRKHQVYSQRAFTEEQLKALEYQERISATLAFSRSADPDYTIETDENEVTSVIFGDGQYGQIPPTGMRILANYRVGGGSVGNVAAGQIKGITRAPQLQLLGAKVVNRVPASGGAERETIEQAIKYAPTVFASMQRAVTAADYEALARLFPGVSKARAETTNWNTIRLYIAPTGNGEEPSDVLMQDLKAYFEDKRMITTLVEIGSPNYVPIQIRVEVGALPYFVKEKVQADAENAIKQLLDFEQLDFQQVLYLSKIYELLENLDGVAYVVVKRFSPVSPDDLTPLADQPDAVPADGRIVMLVNEIPVLRPGDLQITPTGGA
jgi:hypothetical protein